MQTDIISPDREEIMETTFKKGKQLETLLCVDDEVNVLRSLKRLFRAETFRVLTAESSEKAFAILAKEQVHVVMVDQRMPDMTGTQFLQRVREHYPATIRVVLSGYSEVGAILEAINRGEVYRFLGKPWDDDELKTTIDQCFEHYLLLNENANLLRELQQQNETLNNLNQQLENTIREHAKALALTQNVVESLPFPLLCISAEGMVVKVNTPALQCLQQTALGETISGLFCPDVEKLLQQCLAGSLTESFAIFCDKTKHKLQIFPLVFDGLMQGCLIMIEQW